MSGNTYNPDPRAQLAAAETRLRNLIELVPTASPPSVHMYRMEICHLREFVARLREELGHA